MSLEVFPKTLIKESSKKNIEEEKELEEKELEKIGDSFLEFLKTDKNKQLIKSYLEDRKDNNFRTIFEIILRDLTNVDSIITKFVYYYIKTLRNEPRFKETNEEWESHLVQKIIDKISIDYENEKENDPENLKFIDQDYNQLYDIFTSISIKVKDFVIEFEKEKIINSDLETFKKEFILSLLKKETNINANEIKKSLNLDDKDKPKLLENLKKYISKNPKLNLYLTLYFDNKLSEDKKNFVITLLNSRGYK